VELTHLRIIALGIAACGTPKGGGVEPAKAGSDSAMTMAVASGGDARATPEPHDPHDPDNASDARAAKKSGPGRLTVRVTWPDASAAARSEGPRNPCGVARRARAEIGTLHGVSGAVVIVTDVPPPAITTPPAPARMQVRGCRVEPAVVIAPATGVELASADTRRHRVRVAEAGPARDVEAWKAPVAGGAIALAWAGATVAITVPAGVSRVATEASPDEVSWVVNADALAAISDDTGVASFPGLAAGRHHIYVWLPERGDGPQAVHAAADVEVAGDTELAVRLGARAP